MDERSHVNEKRKEFQRKKNPLSPEKSNNEKEILILTFLELTERDSPPPLYVSKYLICTGNVREFIDSFLTWGKISVLDKLEHLN